MRFANFNYTLFVTAINFFAVQYVVFQFYLFLCFEVC